MRGEGGGGGESECSQTHVKDSTFPPTMDRVLPFRQDGSSADSADGMSSRKFANNLSSLSDAGDAAARQSIEVASKKASTDELLLKDTVLHSTRSEAMRCHSAQEEGRSAVAEVVA